MPRFGVVSNGGVGCSSSDPPAYFRIIDILLPARVDAVNFCRVDARLFSVFDELEFHGVVAKGATLYAFISDLGLPDAIKLLHVDSNVAL